jgi:hypothetical protein
MLNFEQGTATSKRQIWRVKLFDQSLGSCTITNDGSVDEDYYTIFIKLNEKSRNKGYGWKSFAAISALSQIDMIFAEAAKKNKSSISALKKAGFIERQEKSIQFNAVYSKKVSELMNIKSFISLVPPSFWVDYASMIVNSKRNVIRTVLATNITPGNYLIDKLGFFMSVDEENFAVIGYNLEVCENVMGLDQSIGGHELIGEYFGYPNCCMEQVSPMLDSEIDDFEQHIVATLPLKSNINITNYMDGKALISHIPCGKNCTESIALAEKTHRFLKSNGLSDCISIRTFFDS